MFVECADDVIDDCRGDSGRDHRSHESNETEQSVGQSDQFCAGEETGDGTEEGDTCGGGCHAVQDKHDFASDLDCVYAIFDRGWPLEACQVDTRLQLRLDDCSWIEMEHSRLVGTFGDVL